MLSTGCTSRRIHPRPHLWIVERRTGTGSAANGVIDTEGAANVNTAALTDDLGKLLEAFKAPFQKEAGKPASYVAAQGFVGTYLLLDKVLRPADSTDPDKLHTAAAWGPDYRSVQTPYATQSFDFGPVSLPASALYAFLVALLMAGALLFFLHRTRDGRALRAMVQNRYAATLMGLRSAPGSLAPASPAAS